MSHILTRSFRTLIQALAGRKVSFSAQQKEVALVSAKSHKFTQIQNCRTKKEHSRVDERAQQISNAVNGLTSLTKQCKLPREFKERLGSQLNNGRLNPHRIKQPTSSTIGPCRQDSFLLATHKSPNVTVSNALKADAKPLI